MKKWIVCAAALVLIVGACFYVYKIIYPTPHVAATDEAIERVKQENADMRRRLDELEKQVRQGAKQIKQEEREKVDAMSPDAVADSIVSELRLFLGSD
jgi:peptidoglycan hydrolase CwlO-like protein